MERLLKIASLQLNTTALIYAGRVKVDSHTFLDSALEWIYRGKSRKSQIICAGLERRASE
jgi:hypothetical protein